MGSYRLLITTLVLTLTACGFQLRGSVSLNLASVYVQSTSADQIAEEVKRTLRDEGVKIPENAKEAQAVLFLRHEVLEKRVLSVAAVTGRVREVEINLRVEMEVQKPEGTVLQNKRLISLLRDYSFDETAVLAMGAEEEAIQKELLRDVVVQIVRGLQTVKL